MCAYVCTFLEQIEQSPLVAIRFGFGFARWSDQIYNRTIGAQIPRSKKNHRAIHGELNRDSGGRKERERERESVLDALCNVAFGEKDNPIC